MKAKNTTSFESYDLFLRKKSRLFNQYMQNTLQLNNGNGQFNEIANYAGVSKQIGVGVRCSLIWTMMVTRIFMFVTEYITTTNQDFVDFFANEFMQKWWFSGKKEQIETIINRMQVLLF
jgi:hypothetical protein